MHELCRVAPHSLYNSKNWLQNIRILRSYTKSYIMPELYMLIEKQNPHVPFNPFSNDIFALGLIYMELHGEKNEAFPFY